MLTPKVTFEGKELIWLAKLSVKVDTLVLFHEGKRFYYERNNFIKKLDSFGRKSYVATGNVKKFKDILWNNMNNGKRYNFINKLIAVGILEEVVISERVFYRFNQDVAYNIFVFSADGCLMKEFFEKHITLFIDK